MPIRKLKICEDCRLPKIIWKNYQNKKYCQTCWFKSKPSKPVKKQKPIPRRSEKRSKEERLYSAKRVLFLADHPMCEAHLPGCMNQASEVHHKKGRVGEDLLDQEFWLALCNACHQYIESERSWAIEQGFSIKRIN